MDWSSFIGFFRLGGFNWLMRCMDWINRMNWIVWTDWICYVMLEIDGLNEMGRLDLFEVDLDRLDRLDGLKKLDELDWMSYVNWPNWIYRMDWKGLEDLMGCIKFQMNRMIYIYIE